MGKQDKIFNKINAEIYKTSDPKRALYNFKKNFSIEIISQYFTKVISLPKFSNVYLKSLYFKNEADLCKKIFNHPAIGIWKELTWNALIINKYHVQLKQFLLVKTEYEKAILLSNFNDADRLLTVMEESFGTSFWLIKNKMNLLQDMHGLEVQKEYARKLKDQEMPMQTKILIYLYSVSSEKNISFSYFNRIINNFFDGFENRQVYEYINFKVKRNYELDPIYFEGVLRSESGSSFVDIYETFIEITQNILCTHTEYNEDTLSFIKLLRKVYKNIEDFRFKNILRSFNEKIPLSEFETNELLLDVFDSFSSENYENVINICKPLLTEKPYYTLLYEPYVESVYILKKELEFPKESLVFNILQSYLNMLIANEKTNDSIHNLLKMTVTYSNMSWTNEIVSFVLNYVTDENSYKKVIGYLNTPVFSPIKIDIYGNDAKELYISDLKSKFTDSVVLNTKILFDTNEQEVMDYLANQGLSKDVKNNYISQYYLHNSDFKKLLEVTEDLLSSSNIFAVNNAMIMYLTALMEIDINKAIEKLVDFYLKNKNLSALLPLMKLSNLMIQEIDKTKTWPTSINSPILLYLCSVYRNSNVESRMQYSYEYFLISHSYTKPTEMIKDFKEKKITFDNKIIFYLKEICIPEIMKKSIYFNGSNDVEKERIEVCHELTVLDSQNKKEYLSEIRGREQGLYIKNEISRLEKNKIYVDIRGVKKLFDKELVEDYKRLQFLIKSINYQIDADVIDILTKIYSMPKSDEFTEMEAMNSLYLPEMHNDEIIDLFRTILEIARDIFVNNEHHGLDVYLSTKIRHGTISNHLRKPLENEHLITLKDKQSNQYNKNSYWENELFKLHKEVMESVQSYLKTFSKEYDDKIRFIGDELLQVSTTMMKKDLEGNILKNENENAMFKYFFSDLTVLHFLHKSMQEEMSFEAFVDYIIHVLWEMTDTNLKKVREYIGEQIKVEMMNNFDILQKKIESINADTSRLKDAIVRAKAETRKSIDNLTNWFARMEDNNRNDYDIKNAISIVANTFGKSSEYIIVESNSECKLKGNTLESFVDIFFNLVNNAFQHCGYQDKAPNILVKIEKESNDIFIEISNDVANKSSLEKLNNELEPIRSIYGKKQASDKLHKEGGTGFYKIERIITKDLLIADHQLDFGYRENGMMKFFVKIKLNGKGILV